MYTGRTSPKKVTVLEAAHNHIFNDKLFKFSRFVPNITRFCHITLILMSDVWSLPCIISNANALIQKSVQIKPYLFAYVTTCMYDLVVFYSRIQAPHSLQLFCHL